VLLSMHSPTRAAILQRNYDEADLKRSHISHAIGCWRLQNPTRPFPPVITRFLHSDASRTALENDMQTELDAARPILQNELTTQHAALATQTT
jgi:hypothetical protein